MCNAAPPRASARPVVVQDRRLGCSSLAMLLEEYSNNKRERDPKTNRGLEVSTKQNGVLRKKKTKKNRQKNQQIYIYLHET